MRFTFSGTVCMTGTEFLRSRIIFMNPFPANVRILYPLKTPENYRFSGVFERYKIVILTRNGLKVNSLN